jgi:hypothetical protein
MKPGDSRPGHTTAVPQSCGTRGTERTRWDYRVHEEAPQAKLRADLRTELRSLPLLRYSADTCLFCAERRNP